MKTRSNFVRKETRKIGERTEAIERVLRFFSCEVVCVDVCMEVVKNWFSKTKISWFRNRKTGFPALMLKSCLVKVSMCVSFIYVCSRHIHNKASKSLHNA